MKLLSQNFQKRELFEGSISFCRDLCDNIALFGRDGVIITARSADSRLRSGENLFSFMSMSEAASIAELCVSFKYNRLIVNTVLGAAIIYTDTCGACGLMTAVFPFAPSGAVFSYFTECEHPSVFISGEARALACGKADNGLCKFLEAADEVFLTVNLALSRYQYGDALSESLTKHILSSAEFLGCVGVARAASDVYPSFDNFSPEIFSAMTHCCLLFARDRGATRSFIAKVGEYNSHPIVSFCVHVEEDFELMRGGEYRYPELNFCLESADRRKTFFECYHRRDKSAVIIAFAPEIDPIDGRIIKQDVEARIKAFWDIE